MKEQRSPDLYLKISCHTPEMFVLSNNSNKSFLAYCVFMYISSLILFYQRVEHSQVLLVGFVANKRVFFPVG